MVNERGNVLFLILIAVALFAALSYAVTNSTRSGGGDASEEKVQTYAAQLIQNATLIENEIMRAKIARGVPEYGFDFYSTNVSDSAINATCINSECKIFQDNGGKIYAERLPNWASTSSLLSYKKPQIIIAQVQDVGTSSDDVMLKYREIQKSLCEALNKALGNDDVNLTDTAEQYSGFVYYNGTMTSFPSTSAVIGDQIAGIAGKRSFCFNHGNEKYTFMHVLMAR